MEAFSYCARSVQNEETESDFRHWFHHVVQIHLVSPFLFNTNYESEHVQRWMVEAELLPLDRYENEELGNIVRSRVELCVAVYTALTKKFGGEPIMSNNNEMVVNSLKWLNKCQPTLDQLISKTKLDWKWMQEICGEVNCGNEKEVVAVILTSLHIMLTKDEIVYMYEKMCIESEKDCKWFKQDGNTQLNNKSYLEAIESFNHGLLAHPFSYQMYVNRSEALIENQNYQSAEIDALRSIFLKCNLAEGYNLLVTAVEKQGYISKAFDISKEAIIRCQCLGDDNSGYKKLKNLCNYIKEKVEKYESSLGEDEEKEPDLSDDDESPSDDFESVIVDDNGSNDNITNNNNNIINYNNNETSEDGSLSTSGSGSIFDTESGINDSNNKASQPNKIISFDDECDLHAGDKVITRKNSKSNNNTSVEDARSKHTKGDQKNLISDNWNQKNQKDVDNEDFTVTKRDSWQEMVFKASTNLVNQHFKLATQLYSEALIHFRDNPAKVFMKDKDIVRIKYAYGMSCVETRSRDKMLESIAIFEEILHKHSHVMFPLVYYGLTYSYVKQNRFKEALQVAKTGLDNTKNMLISPLTWPQIDKNIPESTPGKLKIILEELIELCQSPPSPDAICRYNKCSGHFKTEIYFTDPDCKGFIKVSCDEECSLQYHPNCWKNLKEEIEIFNDKEFLNVTCLTPDCPGGIVELVHIDSKGEVAKRFKSNTWNKGGYPKQKRPRLGKKLTHKEKKKKKTDETVKDDNFKQEPEDDDQLPEYETFESIAATIFDLKPIQKTKPVQNASVPLFPPENASFTVLKKIDEPEETIKKVEKHRERKKEKKKQVLKLNEFFADVEEDEESGQIEISDKPSKRRRKKKGNNHNTEVETASRHSSESDHTSCVSREMGDEELGAASGESLLNETIKKTLFDCMKIFLKRTGQLTTDDHRLIEALARLPIEVQEYIADIGGIQEFLKKSDDFVVYDKIICLTEHFTGIVTTDHCSMLDTITESYEPCETTSGIHFDDVVEDDWVKAKKKNKARKSQMNCMVWKETQECSKWSDLDDVKKQNQIPLSIYSWVPLRTSMEEMRPISSEELNAENNSEYDDEVIKNDVGNEMTYELNETENENGVLQDAKAVSFVTNNNRSVFIKRNDSIEQTYSSSYGSNSNQHYTNLQKLWKFVSKFSDKGQGEMLRLVLQLIIREEILERFSPNPQNVDRAKQTFKFAIDALSDTTECESQTEESCFDNESNPLIKELEEIKVENEELKKQFKEHEDLIAYLLNTKRQKWEEEKKELEKKMEVLINNLKVVDEEKKELEMSKTKLEEEVIKLQIQDVNVRSVRSADVHSHHASLMQETRCSSAPNSTRSRDRVVETKLKLLQQSSTVAQSHPLFSQKNPISSLKKIPSVTTGQQGNPKNSYEKLMTALESKFPTIDREELKGYVQQLRSHYANNRLSGLTIEQIVKEISLIIRMKASRKLIPIQQQTPVVGGMGLERITEPGNAWSKVKTKLSNWKHPEEDEEPCVICHEELKELDKLCVLQCRHRFHEPCIKAWFKQENTCPTCRAHSLLPDEFPCL